MGAEAVKKTNSNAHSIFNIINTLILMPCIKLLLVYIVNKNNSGEKYLYEAMEYNT